jgi:hypothetical protein
MNFTSSSKQPSALDNIKEVIADSANAITSTASNAVSSITTPFAKQTTATDYLAVYNKYIYLGLLLVIIISLIIAYTLYRIITTRLFLNSKLICQDTKVPVLCTEKHKFEFKFDKTGNGERRSYTFWIYINDMNKYRNSFKNVFYITNNDKDVFRLEDASPHVFLDSVQNRMYVRFSKNNDSMPATFSNITDDNLNELMQQGITIPYVPLQRWVHIAIVCNANSYKNYIYAYVDGDLVNTTSQGEKDRFITNCNTNCRTKELRDIDINKNGYVVTGGLANDTTATNGFSGLLAKITTYNYELNQKDIYDDYYAGPIGGLLAQLGLGMYGIRNPIYKL